MDKEKMTLSDLAPVIAKKAGLKVSQVRPFLSNFGKTMAEAIITDGIAKMNGLGTFKLQKVEPRKSVDVNTGEPIMIDGYTKVSFVAEAVVKARINGEEIAEKEVVKTTKKKVEDKVPAQDDPIARLGQQADEIMSIVADINGMTEKNKDAAKEEVVEKPVVEPVETPVAEEPIEEPTVAEEPVIEEPKAEEHVNEEPIPETEPTQEPEPVQPEPEPTSEPEPVSAPIPTPAPAPMPEPVPTPTVEPVTEPEPVPTPAPAPVAEPVAEPASQPKKEKKDFSWLKAALTIVVIFLLLFVIVWFVLMHQIDEWMKTYFEDKNQPKVEQVETPAEQPAPVVEVPQADTTTEQEVVAQETPEIVEAPVKEAPAVAEETAEEEKIDFDAPRTYNKFFTVTLKPGQSLAILARCYYGSKIFWPYIYEANRDRFPDPNDIPIGSKVRIPKLPKGYTDYYNKEARDYAQKLERQYTH